MNKNFKGSAGLLAAVMSMSILSACSQKKPVVTTDEKKEEPTPISIMSVFYSVGPITNDNIIVKEFEKRTNTKLDITWVSGNNYNEKVSVTFASGSIPDMTLTLEAYNAQFRTMSSQGAFWEVGKYYKDYKNMAAFPSDVWENIKMPDGKIYGMPRPRAIDGQAAGQVSLRKDWLDKVKLPIPQTMDDLYKVMQAYTNDDPDGNGQKDTVGIVGYVNQGDLGSLSQVVSIFNGASGWRLEKDGSLAHMWTDPSTKDALLWLRKAFAEGLIHKDTPVLKQTQHDDIIKANKAGINFDPPQKTTAYDAAIKKLVPNAETLPLVALEAKNGKYVGRNGGSFGQFVIPKTVPEAKMKKVMALYDYGVSPEGHELAKYGLPDVHYTKKGENYIATEQAKTDAITTMGNIFAMFDKYGYASMAGTTPEELARNKKLIDEKAKISKPSPNTGLYSETEAKIGADLNKKYTETFMKVMIGSEPIEAWDAFVTKLKSDAEYQKWIKEINDAYKVKAGKK
jgi:putative aldouronate transport system substrate-binding protein